MKPKTVFACQECGAQSAKWLGRCPDCGAWNSLVEERRSPRRATAAAAEKRYTLAASAGPQLYADIDTMVAERLSTGIGEFDRVLGGGVVPGSLVLIGGEPGIGKSTLLLQAAAHFAQTIGPGPLQLGRGIRTPDQVPRRAPRSRRRRRSTSSRRRASSGSSRRSRGCGQRSSSSTRSRPCSR